MPNLNRVFLMGNLTRDPELRYTASGSAVCEFGLAVSRTWTTPDGQKRDETCFVDCSMWGRRGEVIAEHFKKGRAIFVEGRLVLDQWDGKDGQRHSKLKVVAESFEFVGGIDRDRRDGATPQADRPQGQPQPPQQPQGRPQQHAQKSPDLMDPKTDDIPF